MMEHVHFTKKKWGFPWGFIADLWWHTELTKTGRGASGSTMAAPLGILHKDNRDLTSAPTNFAELVESGSTALDSQYGRKLIEL